MIVEGQRVTYIGDDTLIGVGASGRVLAFSGMSSSHVQWLDGLRMGSVDLVAVDDLISPRNAARGEESASDQFDASFEMPTMASVVVRETYDDLGEEGLLTALDEAGHLATLAEYAGEAIGFVAMRIRQDPNFRQIMGQLDEPEAESLLLRVASTLLSEQSTTEED